MRVSLLIQVLDQVQQRIKLLMIKQGIEQSELEKCLTLIDSLSYHHTVLV